MRRAVFLDRDGTMIHDVGYLSRLEDLRWFPFTIDAVRLLRRAGFLVFVTTNQGGIGLGFYDDAFVRRTHEAMSDALQSGGAHVDGWFYCPHHPRSAAADLRGPCDCRKPGPGMIRQAAARFAIDLPGSFVVGDKIVDVQLAAGVGARGILVRTGAGEDTLRAHGSHVAGASLIAANLMEATSWMLAQIDPGRVPGRD